MKTKRNKEASHYLIGYGSIKAMSDGLSIEGFANKNVVDRGNEVITPTAWDLKNYDKNPVILFNHGMDPQLGATPIGVATEVRPTDDGLFIKAKLSAIDDPMLNRIRGLVGERILRAFSVGFNPIDATTDAKSGVKTITKAELFEVSIVGVPMNQDSLFEITSKMMQTKSVADIKLDMLNRKGCAAAAAIHTQISALEKDGKNKDELIAAIVDKLKLEDGEIMEILAGESTPIGDPTLEAIAEVLGMNADDLKKLDAGDVEVETATGSDDVEEGDSEGQAQEGAEAQTETQNPSSGQGGETSVGKGSETPNQVNAGKSTTEDYQSCVSDKIRKLIAEGKDQDQAVAEAIAVCNRERKSTATPTKKQYAEFFKIADAAKQAPQGDGGATPPVTENDGGRAQAENDFGSPHLDAAKQTNVLLGVVINELQKLYACMQGMDGGKPADSATAQVDAAAAEGKATAPATTPPKEGDKPAAAADAKPAADAPPAEPAVSETPDPKMSDADLKKSQAARVKKYGVEVLPDGLLKFADGAPTDVAKYGDPVNLKYPIDSAETAGTSREQFKKDAGSYKNDASKSVVHGRIVAALMAFGAKPSFDEKDPLDALLPKVIKDKLVNEKNIRLDSIRKRLDNVKKHLADIETLGGVN